MLTMVSDEQGGTVYLPYILQRRLSVEIGVIERVVKIPARVAFSRDLQMFTCLEMILGNSQSAQPIGRLDDGRREPHLDMPLDMAVEKIHAGIISLETQDSIRIGLHVDGIPQGRIVLETYRVRPRPGAGTSFGTGEDLEVMAVKVEWVYRYVMVVDDNVDNIALVDNVGMYGTVDAGIGVVFA